MRRQMLVPTIAATAALTLVVGSLPAQAAGLGASGSTAPTTAPAPGLTVSDEDDAESPAPSPTTAEPAEAEDQTPVPVDGSAQEIASGSTAQVDVDAGDDAVAVVGVSWELGATDAPQTVEYRVLDEDGEAGDWIELDVLAGDGPDPGTVEAAGARTGTEPLIIATDEQVEVRVDAGAAQVQALESPVTDADADLTGTQSTVPLPSAATTAQREAVDAVADTRATNRGLTYTTRAQWGANEKLKQCEPDMTTTNKAMVVHHTAGATNYSKQQVPGILRGILNYHTQALGWCDVGYNMLVDRYGTVYEGRAGGVDKAVVGAHASGFNTGTFGVSVMGTYSRPAPQAAVNALGRVGAWQASLWKYSPTSKVTLTSGGGGSAKYAKGRKVSLPRIFGHRDTSATECPGNGLYGQLSQVRTKAKAGYDKEKDKDTSIPVPGQIGKFHAKNKAKTGAPITKQKCGIKGGGCSQKFVRGSVHYKKSTGAHFTTKGSGIQRHWISQKQQNGTLGYPTGEVMRLKGVSSAFAQNFEGGTVVFKKSTGAHTVRGAIGSKWKKLGWARTSMKLPITAQKCTLVRGGCFQKFQGGSIHWSKKTGAHATKGAIQRAWGTQKYEKGRLGYPTSGEFTSGSLKRQNFEGGYITWSKKQGAKIRYR